MKTIKRFLITITLILSTMLIACGTNTEKSGELNKKDITKSKNSGTGEDDSYNPMTEDEMYTKEPEPKEIDNALVGTWKMGFDKDSAIIMRLNSDGSMLIVFEGDDILDGGFYCDTFRWGIKDNNILVMSLYRNGEFLGSKCENYSIKNNTLSLGADEYELVNDETDYKGKYKFYDMSEEWIPASDNGTNGDQFNISDDNTNGDQFNIKG